jgi:hypothetical protein
MREEEAPCAPSYTRSGASGIISAQKALPIPTRNTRHHHIVTIISIPYVLDQKRP